MEVLLITQLWPSLGDATMHSDLAEEFVSNGHQVTVLALNEKRNGQSTSMTRERGCTIIRVRCGNIQKTNKYEKVISSLLAGPALISAMKKYRRKHRFDVIVWALSTTLITGSVIRLKKRYRCPLYLLLKEYWPQDPVDLGAMREDGLVWRYFKRIENRMFAASDYIGGSSPGGVKYVLDRAPEKELVTEVCPHVEAAVEIHPDKRREMRGRYGFGEDEAVFFYGGNFGVSQGIDDMIACIRGSLDVEGVRFVLLGSGTETQKVRQAFADCPQVSFFDSLPRHEYMDFLTACDVGMIFLFRNYHVPNIPGKFNTYLNAGLPVLAATDYTSDVGDIAVANDCGIKIINGDIAGFRSAVKRLKDPVLRQSFSVNAKQLLLRDYVPSIAYYTILRRLADKRVCILSTVDFSRMTPVSVYIEYLECRGITYDIIYADKFKEAKKFRAARYFPFDVSRQRRWGFVRKMVYYWKMRGFANRIFDQNRYDFVIVWGELTAFIFSDILKRRFPNRYAVNILDYYYFHIFPINTRMKQAASSAYINTVTSDGYIPYLPKAEYIVKHNLDRTLLEGLVPRTALREKGKPIRILYIGLITRLPHAFRLIDTLGNDDRYELVFAGIGSEDIDKYIEGKNLLNVRTFGRFPQEDTAKYLNDADILYNLYGTGSRHFDLALSIKLYYAIFLHIPLLTYAGTYTGDVAGRCGISFSMRENAFENLGDRLYDWYYALDLEQAAVKCDTFIREVEDSRQRLFEKLDACLLSEGRLTL